MQSHWTFCRDASAVLPVNVSDAHWRELEALNAPIAPVGSPVAPKKRQMGERVPLKDRKGGNHSTSNSPAAKAMIETRCIQMTLTLTLILLSCNQLVLRTI